MGFLADLILALVQVLDMIFNMVLFLVAARCIMSWFSPDPYNPLVQFIYRVTEPMLRPFRRLFGRSMGGMDFSPVILGIALVFLQRLSERWLIRLAQWMQGQ